MNHQMKKAPALSAAARQMGLTLIELTIVLLILIGLSGLLLPFVQGFIDKTHDSANTDSLKEVSKQIQSYNNLYSGHAENLESLIVGQAAVQTNATATVTLNGGVGVVGAVMPSMMRSNLFTPLTLTANTITQLNNAGISRVMTMWGDAGEGNHTLRATDASAVLTATAGLGNVLAIIDEQFLNNNMAMGIGGAQCSQSSAAVLSITANPGMGVADAAFATDDDVANACLEEMLSQPAGSLDVVHNDYIVLGIGNDSSLIGRTMAEAPIHFAKVGGIAKCQPTCRILLV